MPTIFHNRQTIKPSHYSGEKISDKTIEQLLEVAKYAPTHKLTEPWYFVVFTDDRD